MHAWARATEWRDRSVVGQAWRHLVRLDFLNRGMLFAAVLLLCLVPWVIIVQAVAGKSATAGLVQRFGLSHEAARDVGTVFTTPSSTSSAVTGLSWVFVIAGAIAAAGALQDLYERAFELESRGYRDSVRQLAWLVLLFIAGSIVDTTEPWLRDVGGPVLVAGCVLVGATVFWWASMRLLLGGRLAWMQLLPSAVATGICWWAMDVAFRLTMSDSIVSNYEKYGAIGVVFAIMSFLIAVGVVVILGAIIGLVWREWRTDRKALAAATEAAAVAMRQPSTSSNRT